MPLRVAVQMDPIEHIKIANDSTFVLLLEAQKRGHNIFYYLLDTLSLAYGKPVASVQSLEVADVQGQHFKLGTSAEENLEDFDVILMRQDPPFNMAYITATHILEALPPSTLVVNNPHHVRNAPEKIFVTLFPDLMPPTLITRNRDAINSFRAEHGDVVMKPLYGNGGAAVFKVSREDPNFGSLFDLFATTFQEPWVVQKFLPEIVKGDKRIILIDGKARGAINRVPAQNDIRSNMVRGGSAEFADLTSREKEICDRIGPELQKRGLIFVGIDVIDGWLTEINVTSPTGIRAIERLSGVNLAVQIWDVIEDKTNLL